MLEKLGAPLAVAVSEVAARADQQEAASPRDEAQKTAALLGKAVQLGTLIAAKANVKGADESAESVRATLTALSGRMVADYYRRTARMPEEGDLKKLRLLLRQRWPFLIILLHPKKRWRVFPRCRQALFMQMKTSFWCSFPVLLRRLLMPRPLSRSVSRRPFWCRRLPSA